MPIRNEAEANYVRERLKTEPSKRAEEALAEWERSQKGQQPPPNTNTPQEEAQQAVGYDDAIMKGAAFLYDKIALDSETRLGLLQEAKQAQAPLTVEDGQGGVRETTLDERIEFQQQAMWNSLNPLQKSLISLSEGGEGAWDLVGMGSVSDAQELILDSVDKGELYDAITLIGEVSELGSMASGVAGVGALAVKSLVLGGMKLASKGAEKGTKTVDALMKFARSSYERAGAAMFAETAGIVASSKGGKATLKALHETDSDEVGEQLVNNYLSRMQTVEGPLLKSRDIRALNPEVAQKAALDRIKRQRAATARIDREAEAAQKRIDKKAADKREEERLKDEAQKKAEKQIREAEFTEAAKQAREARDVRRADTTSRRVMGQADQRQAAREASGTGSSTTSTQMAVSKQLSKNLKSKKEKERAELKRLARERQGY